MKTLIAVVVTAILTWVAVEVFHSTRTAIDRTWMISAIKAPGRMAISDIQKDLQAGRYEVAEAKIDALMKTWQRFSSDSDACRGAGIGDIMVTFSQISERTNVEPTGGANTPPGEQAR